jgi:hypothetical protein
VRQKGARLLPPRPEPPTEQRPDGDGQQGEDGPQVARRVEHEAAKADLSGGAETAKANTGGSADAEDNAATT